MSHLIYQKLIDRVVLQVHELRNQVVVDPGIGEEGKNSVRRRTNQVIEHLTWLRNELEDDASSVEAESECTPLE